MAKFQRLKGITEKGWEALDEFYEYEVKGINLYLNNFVRNFCRCGNISSSIEDKCSNCDNFTFITYKREIENVSMYYQNRESIDSRFHGEYISSSNTMNFYTYDLKVCEDSSSNLVEFYIIKDKLISFNLETSEHLSGTGRDEFINICKDESLIEFFEQNFKYNGEVDYILNLLPNKLKGKKFVRYYNAIDVEMEVSSLFKMIFAIDFKNSLKDVFKDKDFFKYPNILKGYLRDYMCYYSAFCYASYSFKKNPKSLRELFDSKISKEYYHLLDFACKQEGSLVYALSSDIYMGSNLSLVNFIQAYENKKYGIEDTIMHYVSNGMISYKEGFSIIKKYAYILQEEKANYFSTDFIYYKPKVLRYWEERQYEKHIPFEQFLTIEHLDFFEIYLKENISNIKEDIMEGFISQIKTMLDYNIPIKEENFKLKTYNFLVNQAILADIYKMPQGKVDMFLDMFEVNPLEAMTLLSNRRKMTKKETDAFLEIMFRNI